MLQPARQLAMLQPVWQPVVLQPVKRRVLVVVVQRAQQPATLQPVRQLRLPMWRALLQWMIPLSLLFVLPLHLRRSLVRLGLRRFCFRRTRIGQLVGDPWKQLGLLLGC